MAKTDFKNVDDYIATFPKEVQATLETVRRTIHKAVPGAEETISYQMPAFRFHGPLVYFAGFKAHFSLFGGTGEVRRVFKRELSRYEGGKGTIRFPLDEPVPVTLIRKIATYRAKENLQWEQQKERDKQAKETKGTKNAKAAKTKPATTKPKRRSRTR